jgi:hypothetical protein
MLAVAPGLQTHLTAFPAGSPHEQLRELAEFIVTREA